MGNKDNVTSFFDRSKEFEEAHYSCKELMEAPLSRIENFVSKWLLIAIGVLFLVMITGFTYFHLELTSLRKNELVELRKKIDHRYFLLKESLEDIHKVKIENGEVVRDY